MLSLKHCRRKLGAGCALEDEELGRIEESLYSLAAIIIMAFQREQNVSPRSSEHEARVLDGPDEREETLIHFETIRRNHGYGPSVEK